VLRHGIEKNPTEVIVVVVLIIAAQISIVLFALIVMIGLAQRRRLDAAARRDVTIQ
jgi:hypothetical protein